MMSRNGVLYQFVYSFFVQLCILIQTEYENIFFWSNLFSHLFFVFVTVTVKAFYERKKTKKNGMCIEKCEFDVFRIEIKRKAQR